METGDNHPALRVAQLIETVETGGAEHLAIRIANGRAAAGDRSFLYVLTGPGELSPRIDPGVEVRYLDFRRGSITRPGSFALSLVRGYRLLRDRLREDGVRVLQTHLPGSNFWGLLLQWRGACRVVPTVHNNLEFAYGDDMSGLRARLRRQAYREMLARCPAVVCVSEKVRESLLSELTVDPSAGDRLAVVPNGVAVPRLRDAAELDAARRRYGLEPGTPLLLAAGRHTEQKDFATLVAAFALVRESIPAARLMLAGNGPLRSDLREQARDAGLADAVMFPGNVDDLEDLYQAADVFVMSSLWEGLPLTLLEAMAGGCPVVGTRIDGIAEILAGGNGGPAGLLAPPSDPRALAETAIGLLRDPDLAGGIGAAARRLVEERFSFARVDRDLGALYAAIDRGLPPRPGGGGPR